MLSANEIETIKEQAYAGFPSKLQGVCEIFPLTIGEIVKMGSLNYSAKLGLLLLTENGIEKILKEKIKDAKIKKVNPLIFLLQSASANNAFFLELEEAFSTFIKEEIRLLPKINAVGIGPMSSRRLITPENFSDFQTILNIQNRKEIPKPPPPNESDYAKKMRLAAELRDEIKRKQQQKENGAAQSLADLLEIAEVFGIDYKNKTVYAFYGLLQRFQRKEKWQQDIQMLCAGADSKKIKAEYWGSNS